MLRVLGGEPARVFRIRRCPQDGLDSFAYRSGCRAVRREVDPAPVAATRVPFSSLSSVSPAMTNGVACRNACCTPPNPPFVISRSGSP